MVRRIVFPLILLGYVALAVLFATNTPAWQAPDEPAHYNYVRYLAEEGGLPVLHFGDYPHGYLEQIKEAQFPPDMSVEPIRYESHQPPLYYALLAPVYQVTAGSLTALRLVSVLLGAGIVALAYATGRRFLPGRPAVALGAAAFVAFLPQHLATVSQVGNDVLAELLYAGVLYVLVGLVGGETAAASRTHVRDLLLLGVLLGLIAITKTTAYIAVPLVGGVRRLALGAGQARKPEACATDRAGPRASHPAGRADCAALVRAQCGRLRLAGCVRADPA
jgi:4-amino-4-deoxy-L-arabinose transferase-like glycosyltransferase